MDVIGLARVSTLVQVREGDSIEAQIERIKQFCQEREYNLIEVLVDEGKSGTVKDDKIKFYLKADSFEIRYDLRSRPALHKILNRARDKEFQGLVFFKWDRFSRDLAFLKNIQRYLKGHGITLIPTDDSDDPLASDIVQVMSSYEIEKTKSRVRQTRLLKYQKGEIVAKAPYGYKKNMDKKIILNQNTSKIVRRAFEMTANGQSSRSIYGELKIHPQAYYNLIRNKVYMGYVEFEGEIKKGVHPLIVSEDLYKRANEKLSN